MGVCSIICNKKAEQIVDNVEERISTKQLNGNADPDKNSLKNYLETSKKQMIPVIRDIFYKILSEKPKTIKIFNEKILQRQVKFLCVALRYCNTLEVLNLRNNHLSPCGAVIISGVFKYTVHLTQLVLEDNHIKGEGMKVICENLHILSSLELLSLSQNTLGDSANELADNQQ